MKFKDIFKGIELTDDKRIAYLEGVEKKIQDNLEPYHVLGTLYCFYSETTKNMKTIPRGTTEGFNFIFISNGKIYGILFKAFSKAQDLNYGNQVEFKDFVIRREQGWEYDF